MVPLESLPEPNIDHPAQEGWHLSMLDPIPLEVIEDISTCVPDGFEQNVLHVIEMQTSASRVKRQSLQKANMVAIAPTREELFEYRSLVGQPESLGKLLSWFNSVTRNAFNNTDPNAHVNKWGKDPNDKRVMKLGMEMAGSTQSGNRRRTNTLDNIFRGLHLDLMQNVDSDILVAAKEHAHAERTYRVDMGSPLISPKGVDAMHSALYMTIERRRSVADIYFPGGDLLKLFKISNFVVFPDFMPEDDYTKIHAVQSQADAVKIDHERFFEEVVEELLIHRDEYRGAIFPIASQYVAFKTRDR